ncbi:MULTISPECIES: type II secretion system protein N [Acinetobacter]|uniref:PDZ domain-containing protein n=1 Tax=Acinetobacter piscicola TaxID=2006115 RepID=A0A7S6VU32_9GAMM|nr:MULTISPECIES: type II secretion system protein N [Acinetobacter]QOW44773.1 PDZ domain-containing protein [Acinetobacter piscicola]
MNFQQHLEHISWKKLDKLAPVVLLLLILAIAWKLAAMFWWVIAPPQVIQPEAVQLGAQQPQVPNISSFALFYEANKSEAAADETIPMQLQGVVVGYPSRNSSAVIKVNEVADRFIVGQNIDNSGYELSEVYWDRVILRQASGATRELKFNSLGSLYQPIEPNQSGSASVAPLQQDVQPATEPSPSNSQSALTQAIEKMNQDKDQYLKNMGVNTQGGQGYEVTDQTPAVLRNKLGLRSGDRIISLNGQAVGQGQSDIQLLEQAKRDGKVRIEIKRGDQVMTIQQSL